MSKTHDDDTGDHATGGDSNPGNEGGGRRPRPPADREYWARRRVCLGLFEGLLGAARRHADGEHHHEWAGRRFDCVFPAGRQDEDWAWAYGYSGPAFTEDLAAAALAEAALRARGLRGLYVEELCRLLPTPAAPGDLTVADVFDLVAAPAAARAAAAWSAYDRAVREGRV